MAILLRTQAPPAGKTGGEVNSIVRLLFSAGEFKVLAAIKAAGTWKQEIH